MSVDNLRLMRKCHSRCNTLPAQCNKVHASESSTIITTDTDTNTGTCTCMVLVHERNIPDCEVASKDEEMNQWDSQV